MSSMTSEIGYGAAAIKAGEVKYQEAMVKMLKEAAKQPETQVEKSSPPPDAGKKVDISV